MNEQTPAPAGEPKPDPPPTPESEADARAEAPVTEGAGAPESGSSEPSVGRTVRSTPAAGKGKDAPGSASEQAPGTPAEARAAAPVTARLSAPVAGTDEDAPPEPSEGTAEGMPDENAPGTAEAETAAEEKPEPGESAATAEEPPSSGEPSPAAPDGAETPGTEMDGNAPDGAPPEPGEPAAAVPPEGDAGPAADAEAISPAEADPAAESPADDKARVPDSLLAAIEALLFSHGEPVSAAKLAFALEEDPARVEAAVAALEDRYAEPATGLRLARVAGGFQLTTRADLREVIERLLAPKREEALSESAVDALSVIAYRQPITVPELNELRGVNSQSVVSTLLRRRLIRSRGRKKVVGRPMLYGTTDEFLERFGLEGLDDLPELGELEPPGSASSSRTPTPPADESDRPDRDAADPGADDPAPPESS